MRLVWDETKNLVNRDKHGVSFEEAAELFSSGVEYLEIYDEAHSAYEDRFIALGPIHRGLLFVVWTEQAEDLIRIISARWATRGERELYYQFMRDRS